MVLGLGACSSGDGLSLDPDATSSTPTGADATAAGDRAIDAADDGAGTTTSDPTGTTDHVVPAIGYECADGTMVYSTDTSHGRDGERWSVAYEAAAELEQRC